MSAENDEYLVCPFFCDGAIIHDINIIHLAKDVQSMRDEHTSSIRERTTQ
jgi:hypothetical protein